MAEPIAVSITGPVPVPVEVVGGDFSGAASATTTAEQDRQSAGERLAARTAPPRTTEEQDRVTAGQRAVNLIWETTQKDIALWVVKSALAVGILLSVGGKYLGSPDIQLAAMVFLFGVANLVTGFYFGRTNHQRTGGIGGDQAGPR